MNVLCLIVDGHTGYSRAGQELALCLDAGGANVTCRYLRLHGGNTSSPRLEQLLERPHAEKYDVCLQVMLPHQMRKLGSLPTYGYFFWETSHFRASSWARGLNRLDGVIAPARNTLDACRESGVTAPLYEVPLPCDVSKYERTYEPLPAVAKVRENSFVFYSVGEFIRRKGWNPLLTAYFLEFTTEPVHLVVKTHRGGMSRGEFEREFVSWTHKLFASLKVHADVNRYPPVTLLNNTLTDEEMFRLHASGDCYVSASLGEGWCVPAVDAMAMGKTPVYPTHTGYLAWSDESVGYPFSCDPTPCKGVVELFADLYRADEEWWQPSIPSLRRALREAFTAGTSKARETKAKAGLERAYRFGYEAVFPRLCEVLSGKETLDHSQKP